MGRRGRPRKLPLTFTTPSPVDSSAEKSGKSFEITPRSETQTNFGKKKSDEFVEIGGLAVTSQAASVQRQLELGKSPVVMSEVEDIPVFAEETPVSATDNPPKDTEKELPRFKKGMRLDYVPPTLKNGLPVACLDLSDVEIEAAKWKHSVILYVVGDTPTIRYLHTYLTKQCIVTDPEIFFHNEGYFVVRFKTMEERNSVLFEGPHTIANRPVIVKAWEANFSFEKEILKVVPLWIQLPNLPLNCWGVNSLSRIGSVVGKPIYADECTATQSRISFARMLVAVDVTQPLKHRVIIEGEQGKMVEQSIIYDWIPPFCQTCQSAGHNCNVKPKLKGVPVQKQQWKPNIPQVAVQIPQVAVAPNITTSAERPKDVWSIPKKTFSEAVVTGTQAPITNSNQYQMLHEDGFSGDCTEGGDLFPSVET